MIWKLFHETLVMASNSASDVIQNLVMWEKGKSGEAAGNNNIWWVQRTFSKNPSCSGKGASNDSNLSPESVIPTTPEDISSSSVRIDTKPSKASQDEKFSGCHYTVDCEISDDDNDILFASDDDISLDDSDLVNIEKNHESRKKIKWFKAFFNGLDKLSNEEINKHKWQCPACQGGAGAIYWYKGKEPLMNHAKTIKSKRVRLHRLFAEILEEELRGRGASVTMASGTFGRWKGLEKQEDDFDIVWPPMVLIMNTRYEQDEKKKWIGMGNQELLDCFSSYAPSKAQHAFGLQGHQGMSVLIFESSPFGYFNAVRLHEHFSEHKRDREAWNHCRTPVVQDGKLVLFGFLASEKDVDFFNRHSTGNLRVKFEMRSYREVVCSKLEHTNTDNEQLDHLRNELAKEKFKLLSLAESLLNVSEKLRRTTEQSNVAQRTKVSGESSKKQEVKDRLQDKEPMQLEAETDKISKVGEDKKASFKKNQDRKASLEKKHCQEKVEKKKKLYKECFQVTNKCSPGQSSEKSGRN